MAHHHPPPVGATVTCTYRGEHRGVVLALTDPRAWPKRAPDDVPAHVAWCQSKGLLRATVPVMWPFGVMWDRNDALDVVSPHVPHRSEGLHVDYGPRGMVDYCDLDCD